MTLAQRQILIACLALLCGGAALANDPPKEAPKADAKKEEKKDDHAKKDEKKDDKKDDKKDAKADAPAEPELPSKPYPKNASPKAFAPKAEPKKDEAVAAKAADKPADKPAEKAAEKAADKRDAKAADKLAEKPADKPAAKPADKPADKLIVVEQHQPAHDKPATKKRRHAAAPRPVTDPALAAVARDTLRGSALGGAYQVKAGDNVDSVIKKTLPNSPFSMEVMREAFARANPQLLATVKSVKLKPGSTVNIPSAAVLRQVVLGDPAPQAEAVRVRATAELHTTAPVVAPTIAPTASELNPPIAVPRLPANVASNAPAQEVGPEEKKKWVRYP